jgi:hypothetical protein
VRRFLLRVVPRSPTIEHMGQIQFEAARSIFLPDTGPSIRVYVGLVGVNTEVQVNR